MGTGREPATGGRESARDGWPDARNRQVEGLLPGDDLRGFSGRSHPSRNSTINRANLMRLPEKQPRVKLDAAEYTLVQQRVLERDGWRCQECGSAKLLHVHHLKPKSQLGSDVMQNLITLCVFCHGKRHGR
jgi:HNH endonuclease